MAHRMFVDKDGDGFRWACSCRKYGQIVKSRHYAEQLGEKHVARSERGLIVG